MHNTIPSSMYLFNHGLHGFGDWESLPLIGAIGIKKKSVQFFVNTVTFYLHYVVFVFINKKKYLVISVLLSAFLLLSNDYITIYWSLVFSYKSLFKFTACRPSIYIHRKIYKACNLYVCCSVLPSLCIQKKMSSSLKFKLNAYLLYFNIR